MHKELELAIQQKDYEKICQFLHTNHYESDSEWTRDRCNISFIQGWKECEKLALTALAAQSGDTYDSDKLNAFIGTFVDRGTEPTYGEVAWHICEQHKATMAALRAEIERAKEDAACIISSANELFVKKLAEKDRRIAELESRLHPEMTVEIVTEALTPQGGKHE